MVALADEKQSQRKIPIPPIAFRDGKIDFERHVQPIFWRRATNVTGTKKIKGKLRLDAKELGDEGWSTGGGDYAGKGKQSYLVKRLRGRGG